MEELKTRIRFLGNATFSNFKPTSNPSFHKATLRIMAIEQIANKWMFSKKSVERALTTIDNVPLVTFFNERTNNLGDHDVCMKDGSKTYGVGTIAESCEQWIEEVEENGMTQSYLCSEVIFWKRQKREYDFIKRHKELSISMEVQPTEAYRTKDGLLLIEDFYFTAITILGIGINPAFDDAVLTFSKQDENYQQMLTELKEFESGGFSMDENQNMNEQNKTNDEGEKPNHQDNSQQSEEGKGDSGSNQNQQENNHGDGEDQVAKYKAQIEQLEIEYSKTIRDLTKEKEELHNQLKSLTTEKNGVITSLEEELKTLREYKVQSEKIQRETAQKEVLQRYADMKDYDGYEELMGQLDSLSAEELEDKLNLLYGRAERAKREKQRSNKVQPTKINITTPTNHVVNNNQSRYGIS